MRTRMIAAIAAAVLALVGIIAMVAYAGGAQERALDNAQMVKVYRAVAEIPAGTAASELGSSVEVAEIPQMAVVDEAVRDLASVEGSVTTGKIFPGEQLIENRFAAPGAAQGAEAIPDGQQLITVAVGSDAAVGGAVAPGARVGLLATMTADGTKVSNMFAQNVLVSSVRAGGDGSLVTLAVDGKLATKIASLVEGGGALRLTLQTEKTDRDAGGKFEVKNLVK